MFLNILSFSGTIHPLLPCSSNRPFTDLVPLFTSIEDIDIPDVSIVVNSALLSSSSPIILFSSNNVVESTLKFVFISGRFFDRSISSEVYLLIFFTNLIFFKLFVFS